MSPQVPTKYQPYVRTSEHMLTMVTIQRFFYKFTLLALISICLSLAFLSRPAEASISSLKWPLSGILDDRIVTLPFGADWPWGECPPGVVKKHVGLDVSAIKGEDIFAADAGIVKAVIYDPTWEYCVTIEHAGFTTVCWHVYPVVAVGNSVSRGQKIGTVADMGANTHLHFGVRDHAYSNISNRGALPQDDCGGDPGFPEYFIDPETLKYSEDKTEWYFETAGDTEGWTAANVESYSVGGGILYIDPDGSDPYITSPYLSADASNYNVVLFRMASNAPDGVGAIYFKTESEDYYSEGKKVVFNAANEPGGSANYYDYPVYMYDPDWAGTITGIRIDPSDTGISGTGSDTIGFDFIKLIDTSSVTCNNAQHVDDSGNIIVSPNESFTIWFSVENTGTSVWSENTLHRLGWLSGYEPFPGYSFSLRIYLSSIVTPGASKTWSAILTAPSTPGTYPITWQMVQDQVQWFGDQMSIVVTVESEDTTPPTPNPMTWSTEPYETSTSSISMVATTASDPTPPISYHFDFYSSPTGGSGGNDSGWQSSTSYSDYGLETNHQYGYRVKARDSASTPNETDYSSTVYKYTHANAPGTASFSNVNQTSIRANWTANGNPSGTEYYCENTTAGANSGWTTNTYWNSTGLTCGTSYTFRVKARNGNGTQTGWTNLGYQSTQPCLTTPTVTTTTVSSITSNSASSGGNVTSNGGSSVTARGVCWSTSANPTTSDSHTSDGTGTGSFTSSITGLSPNTTYHVRAYATNSEGTGYGSEETFSTKGEGGKAMPWLQLLLLDD